MRFRRIPVLGRVHREYGNHGNAVCLLQNEYFHPGTRSSGILTVSLEECMVELKDGALTNVGPANKSATVKLFDVETAGAREFGDKRVKLVFEDGEGNEVQVALFPDDVRRIVRDMEALEDDSPVFE